MGKVYLIGAGPGDAGLITVKGLEKLKKCDAVVYDRLASEELLDAVPTDSERIYVGKEPGSHSKTQKQINEILVDCARKHPMVVRLKGGDPFVFGRGGEEIEALNAHGIPYEVIPGVTSAVAVPEWAGIPVTHRGVARSFHVITGHTNTAGTPDYDYETLAKTEGTLVFLMGLSNLKEIAARLIAGGKPADTPAAVISNGTTPYQKTVRGTLGTIARKARENGLSSPAVIVIGQTAQCEYRCSSDSRKKVGITATRQLREKLEAGLEEIGMVPIPVCDMQVIPTGQMQRLGEELHHLKKYQWVLFTSQNGVTLFFQEMKRQQIDLRVLGSVKFAALGSGTAARLAQYGIQVDFIPSEYTSAALAQEFSEIVKKGEKVLLPRAAQGSRELTDILIRKQVDHLELAIYDVTGRAGRNLERLNELDYLVFVSASGVSAFFRELRARALSLPKHIKLACIGTVTERRLLEEYGQADVVASTKDAEGLLRRLKEFEENTGRGDQYGSHEKTASQ